jgi:tetratricopeptide (TPR) repeat protein/transcriptional regulator with XRE-family HTH domain
MAAAHPLSFADLLRRARHAAGLSQQELAERAGLGRTSISELERGLKRAPHKDTVARLADALSLAADARTMFASAARRRHQSQRPSAPFDSARLAPPRGWVGVPALVGRTAELALLGSHLTLEGAGLLLLAGEPGIGKSRLLDETAWQASEAGWAVVRGGCIWHGTRDSYSPLLDALAGRLHEQSRAELRAALKGCGWLVRLLPELAETQLVPAPAWTLPPDQERRLIFAAVSRFLANTAGPHGTLLVLDDLQWAGSDALDLLATLVRTDAARPLRVVGAYRDTEVRSENALATLLADLGRAGLATQARLGPLAPHDAATLLHGLLQELEYAGAKGEPGGLADRVLRRAGGVPFYLVSCAQSLASSPEANEREQQAPDDIPLTVTQQIRQRVSALPHLARELLDIAAVVGRTASGPLLMAVAGWPEAKVVNALEAACRARLLIVEPSEAAQRVGADRWMGKAEVYRFAHDLIEEVVVADLNPSRCRVLHRLVAEALEARLAEGERPRWAAVLAWHFAQAAKEAKALPYALLAGDRARAAQAHGQAEEHFRMALELALALGDRAREAEALEKLGAVLAPAERARPVVEQTVEVYRTIGDVAGEARATTLLGNVLAYHGNSAEGIARLRALLWRFPSGELAPNILASLYKSLADLYHNLRQYDEGLKAAEQAAESARAAGDARLLLFAEWRYGMELWASGHIDAGGQTLERVIPVAEVAGETVLLVATLANLAWIHCCQGTFDTAWRYLERALALVEPTGNAMEHNFVVRNRGVCAYLLGRWEEAQTYWECAHARLALTGPYMEAIYPPLYLGILCMARGQWQTASEYLDPAIAQATITGDYQALRWAHAALAERELLDGRPDLARARLASLLDGPGQQEPDVTRILPLVALAHLNMGNETQAQSLVIQCVTRATDQHIRIALVDALRIQALVAMRQRRWQEATDALEEALSLCRTMPYPYAEAKALYVYGQLSHTRSAPGQARKQFEQALAILNRLGEGLYATLVKEALAHLPDS